MSLEGDGNIKGALVLDYVCLYAEMPSGGTLQALINAEPLQ